MSAESVPNRLYQPEISKIEPDLDVKSMLEKYTETKDLLPNEDPLRESALNAATRVIKTPDEELFSLAWELDYEAIDNEHTRKMVSEGGDLQFRYGNYKESIGRIHQPDMILRHSLELREKFAERIMTMEQAIKHNKPFDINDEIFKGARNLFGELFRGQAYRELFGKKSTQ